MNENVLLSDLGVIAIAAAATAFLCNRLRLPNIPGYLIAGLLLGPHLFEHAWIQDFDLVDSISDLGMIFILFALGMGFDLKKVQTLFGTAIVAVSLQTAVCLYLGFQMAPLFGFSKAASLLLGCILALSSTIVTQRILRDQHALQLPQAQLSQGVLMLEDVIALIILIVMSGLAAKGSFGWDSGALTVFLVGIFVVATFYVGRITMPSLLKKVHKVGSFELVTLFAVGSALGIGILTKQFNLSLALGAFLAGSLFSNSIHVKQLKDAIAPIRQLFSAVFFVSMGMSVLPAILAQHWLPILLLASTVIIAKIATCSIGLFISGQRTRHAFQSALAKSHIGEFSFVIAKLAQGLGWCDEKLLTVAAGVSFLTIMAAPALSFNGRTLYAVVIRATPMSVREFATVYHRLIASMQTHMNRAFFFRAVKRPFWQIVVAFFLINGMIIGANLLSEYLLQYPDFPSSNPYFIPLLWILTAALVAPFFTSILRNLSAVSLILTDILAISSKGFSSLSLSMRRIINYLVTIFLLFLIGGAFISALSEFLPQGMALMLFVVFIGILALVFQRHLIKLNSELEHRFSGSFSAESKQLSAAQRTEALQKFNREFDWKSLTATKTISSSTAAIGKPIAELGIREKTGATVLAITRGEESVYDPNPGNYLFSGDRLTLLGTPDQIQSASRLLDTPRPPEDEQEGSQLRTEAVYIEPDSFLEGDTLAGSGLRSTHGITVIGLKRGEHPVSDPQPHEVLRAGDLLLIMGKAQQVEAFQKFLYDRNPG